MTGLDVVVLLAVAAVGLVVGRLVRLPPLVAYLVAGVLVGPGALGLVTRSEAIAQVAELGVALLLFGVGIEFALDRLRRELPRMLTGGGVQVTLTVVATAAAFHALGEGWPAAILAGFLASLSSTAVVFRLYDERGELDAPHGQAAAGILLFQDLALVPMILLVPVLAAPPVDVVRLTAMALGKAALALAVLLFLARAVLPRTLILVARSGTAELFPLAALVAAFGTAALAVQAGLSLPIGAFLAGLALSGSPYARQVFAEIVPLRDAFVAVFFTSVGLLVDPAVVVGEPGVLAAMLAAVAVKGLLVAAIVGLLWRSARLAVLTGFALAQIGEFSFVLMHQAVAIGLVSPGMEHGLLGAGIISMAATPFLVRVSHHLARRDTRQPRKRPPRRGHVVVLGHGMTGQAIARVLGQTGIPFVAVELAADLVAVGRREGVPVEFGDATRRAVLLEMGVATARAAVVTVGDPAATRTIVGLLRQINPDLPILVRARRVTEIDELERLGANEVVPSEFETAVELFVRLLRRLGVPPHVTRMQESVIRTEHYRALRGLGSTDELLGRTKQLVAGGILEVARVLEGSEACGQTLAGLALRHRTGTLVLSIVREEQPLPTPDGDTRLEANDLVVLFGPHEAIARALALLEPRAPSLPAEAEPRAAAGPALPTAEPVR